HEGEEHGTPPTAPPSSRHTLVASSDRYELVVKSKPLSTGEPGKLELYLSDFTTNAPIAAASIQLSLRAQPAGQEVWRAGALPAEMPGAYAAEFTPGEGGVFNLIVSVAASGAEDELALAGLEVGAGRAALHTNISRSRPLFWTIIPALVVAAFAGWRLRVGRR